MTAPGGDDVIATGAPAAVQAHAPPAPTVEDAEIATRRHVGFAHHRFPTCSVCGTAREAGLRICAGQVGDGPLIASAWTPQSDGPLSVWAVLDCPSAYAIASVDHRTQIVVLASLTTDCRTCLSCASPGIASGTAVDPPGPWKTSVGDALVRVVPAVPSATPWPTCGERLAGVRACPR
jgi:hypothetical protein